MTGEGRFSFGIGGLAEWVQRAREWRDIGATHLCRERDGRWPRLPRARIDAILKVKQALDGP